MKKKEQLKGIGKVFTRDIFITEVEYLLDIYETRTGQDDIRGSIKILDDFEGFIKNYPETILDVKVKTSSDTHDIKR